MYFNNDLTPAEGPQHLPTLASRVSIIATCSTVSFSLITPAFWNIPVILSMERPMRKLTMMMPMKMMKHMVRNSVAPWYTMTSLLNLPAKSSSPNIIARVDRNDEKGSL